MMYYFHATLDLLCYLTYYFICLCVQVKYILFTYYYCYFLGGEMAQ